MNSAVTTLRVALSYFVGQGGKERWEEDLPSQFLITDLHDFHIEHQERNLENFYGNVYKK
jgi:hypothetical protein